MRALPRRASPFVTRSLFPALFVAALHLSCGVGDQFCTEDQSPSEKDDDCPYGPPGGPKPPAADCPDIPQDPDGTCSTDTADWVNDVFPIFATEGAKKASCTSLACHGGDPATAPRVYLPVDDAKASFEALTKYDGAQKYPYVNTGDPKHSWILCNLEVPPGVGQVMPAQPGAMTPEELATVKKWASCGMVYDKGAMGSGGSGGSGGAGGAGGN
ncbi:MAG: hypothetical protein HUU21_34725 [Polyangiaceae bacterium]|nr:hypothetical protein [Polyangiaceae bacterium]NUQ78712.1 hypothetical protein [Polyangiaceae bacterium]